MNYPLLVFLLSAVVLWAAAWIGVSRRKSRPLGEDARDDFDVARGASLGLLGLLIGFTFSMAISHYDQRKIFEADEANAIGTEYERADLLRDDGAASVRELLKQYLDQRVLFYQVDNENKLKKVTADTAELQRKLWSAVQIDIRTQPTAVVALAVAGMNNVLDSEGYTRAAWWNRIPVAAWILMASIAICCNLLIGYTSRGSAKTVLFVLPLTVATSFLLIVDIDSPRGGIIRVHPVDLLSLSESLRAP